MPLAPQGRSGFGVTRGVEGLLAMTRPKAIAVRSRFRLHLLVPQPADEAMFANYIRAAHGKSLRDRLSALGRLLGVMRQRGKSA